MFILQKFKFQIVGSVFFLLLSIQGFSQRELSASEIDQVRQENIRNKKYEYEGLMVKYDVVINSVKVSEADSAGIVQDLTKIQGDVQCEFHPRSFSLLVTTEKGNKYLNIVDIQNILMAHNLHLMTFQEILFRK